jgi:hypothetical protein
MYGIKALVPLLFVCSMGAQAQSFDASSLIAAGTGCGSGSFAAATSPENASELRITFQNFTTRNNGTVFCNLRVLTHLPSQAIYQFKLQRITNFEFDSPVGAPSSRFRQFGTLAGMPLRNSAFMPGGSGTHEMIDDLLMNRCAAGPVVVNLDLKTSIVATAARPLSISSFQFKLRQVSVLPCGPH